MMKATILSAAKAATLDNDSPDVLCQGYSSNGRTSPKSSEMIDVEIVVDEAGRVNADCSDVFPVWGIIDPVAIGGKINFPPIIKMQSWVDCFNVGERHAWRDEVFAQPERVSV